MADNIIESNLDIAGGEKFEWSQSCAKMSELQGIDGESSSIWNKQIGSGGQAVVVKAKYKGHLAAIKLYRNEFQVSDKNQHDFMLNTENRKSQTDFIPIRPIGSCRREVRL